MREQRESESDSDYLRDLHLAAIPVNGYGYGWIRLSGHHIPRQRDT